MQTQAARPAIETAASLPSPELASLEVDRDEGGFSMLEALVSTRSGAIQPHGTRQPDTSGDPRYVEILSNGEVVAGTVTAAPAAMIADQAPAAVGAGFSADLESLVHEAKFNSYHRMLGPPD
jgi:hypothetical protein